MNRGDIAVIDVGKTHTKLVRVDAADLAPLATVRLATPSRRDGPYPHPDTEAIWDWLLDGLAAFVRAGPIGALTVTAHGAAGAVLAGDRPALPVLDYEHDGPDGIEADYAPLRPPFSETWSPPLPLGLTWGRQLFWQSRTFARDFARATAIVPYAQFWSWKVTGRAVSEITSLGSHTDLWDARGRRPSSLARGQGWDRLMPPLVPAWRDIGPPGEEVRRRTGLGADLPVHAGIHDSNASLLPHMLSRPAPFSVVSSGTWAIHFAVGGRLDRLDPARDCLANINALGEIVPSARYMGGREFELLTEGLSGAPRTGEDDLAAALAAGGPATGPGIVPGFGPYPGHRFDSETLPHPRLRAAAASLYLAEMTARCLELTGAGGPTLVEGPFARNPAYNRALAEITGRPVQPTLNAGGTALGAALLTRGPQPIAAPEAGLPAVQPGRLLAAADHYSAWRQRLEAQGVAGR